MPTVNFTQWYDDVLPSAPGCAPAMALDMIRKSAIEFCQETRVWHYEHPAISVVANTADYPFVPPAGTVVTEILDAWYDGVWVEPKGSDDLAEINGNWLAWTGPRPIYVTQPDERTLRLVPKPTVSLANGLVLLVALKPTIAATTIEERLYQEYREKIADGALARLYMMPKMPYTDFKLGKDKATAFRSHCNEVYNKAARAHTRGTETTISMGRGR